MSQQTVRADRIRAGDSIAGFPNREIIRVGRFDTRRRGCRSCREGQSACCPPESWVRITTARRTTDYPPDYELDVFRAEPGDDSDLYELEESK